MTIQLEKGVRAYGLNDYGRSLEFVGEWDSSAKGMHTQFSVGAYGFSNPYSANMFSYLYRQYDPDTAKSTVQLFEKTLKKSALKGFYELLKINWGDVLARNWRNALDWQATVINLAVAAGGWCMTQLRLSGALAEQNPNSAKQDQEEYVNYAIAYWGKNPMRGPAYQILRY